MRFGYRKCPYMVLTVPFVSKFYRGYDIINDQFVWRWWRLVVSLTPNGPRAFGVSRFKWFPFLIWTWADKPINKIAWTEIRP